MKSHEIHIEFTYLNNFFILPCPICAIPWCHDCIHIAIELENKQWGWLSMTVNSCS